jgi:hypothetical protein
VRKIRIVRKRNRGVWGLAFPDDYRIELDPGLSDELLMEIASHEAMHIAFPYLSEEAIDAGAKLVADVLWRLDFRLGD